MGRPARARASFKARGGSAQPRLSANSYLYRHRGPGTCRSDWRRASTRKRQGGHFGLWHRDVYRKKKLPDFFSAVEALSIKAYSPQPWRTRGCRCQRWRIVRSRYRCCIYQINLSLSLSLDLASGCTRHLHLVIQHRTTLPSDSYPFVSVCVSLFGDVITDPAGTSIIAAGAPAAIASAFSEAHAQGSLDIARYMKL